MTFRILCLVGAAAGALVARAASDRLDPAAWGSDHVGKPLPEYVTGDQCLFCHRDDVGPSWPKNRHQQTLREAAGSPELAALRKSADLKPFAEEVKLLLGSGGRTRFLKPGKEYGKLELLDAGRPHWDARKFADSCAGCHATAVDARTRAFAAPSIDCYACHGDVDLKHTKDTTLVHLARKRKDPARVVTSVCAQCHVRTGTSRSNGLPYPNHFVAGDNLFRDFKVDLSDDALRRLNPGDRHVLENVRDVAVLGKDDVTCLACHDVHKQSAKKHHTAPNGDLCLNCHNATGSKKERKKYEVHSELCGY